MRINVGCGMYPADGWVNLDLVSDDVTHPDVVVTPADPLPFDPGTVTEAYLGHVLEHIPWPDLPAYLAQLRTVLAPGASVAFVGPDVRRTIEAFRRGDEGWERVLAGLENADEEDPARPGAHHQWNCHESRLQAAVDAAGFVDVRPCPISEAYHSVWPVVDIAADQCCVIARNPEDK